MPDPDGRLPRVAEGSTPKDLGLKLAIMQPYFLPYIGYFQLIAAVDIFVVYDRIKYTKKGWINRNRLLRDGADATFSLPLKSDSDALDIVDRRLAANFDRRGLLNQFRGAYARAPQFDQCFPLLERIVRFEDDNLFAYLHHSIVEICAHLGLRTGIRVSSTIDVEAPLKGQDKVLSLCRALQADTYINPSGGTELYSREAFADQGVSLRFLRALPSEYAQFGKPFVPWLSIVDVLMFNPLERVRERVFNHYELF